MSELRRGLNVWEAIGISIALMAPSMAANINPQATAGSVGRAVPLAFGLATVGVLLVAYAFVRLCQHFHHAGSVYGFVGATLGARAGLVAGWALLGTYVLYGVVTSTAAGIFGASFLDEVGAWKHQPSWAPFLIGTLALLGVLALTVSPVRSATRVLLTAEGATVLLILVISLVVLIRLLNGSAPHGRTFTWSVFSVAPGTDVSTLFLGAVFGFLSFAGFEAAATLGEESRRPRRDIPRAILGTAIFGGVYFIVVTAIEVMGFGTDDAGVKAFTNSGSLLGDLGTGYVGAWAGNLVTLGAAVSAFGCALACGVGAARLAFAFGRDGVAPARLGAVSPRLGTPHVAALTVVVMMGAVVLLDALAFGASAFEVFLWSGTIGTLILLVAYVLATLGAIRLLFFSGRRLVPAWQIVIPLLALVVVGYTLYRNVIPYPTGAARWFPVVCLIWLAIAVVYVIARPGVARRAGRQLAVSTAPELEEDHV
ncbi:APC family permease [Actinoplanes subtropicus]|uniref:APC family permease n=1 Tax=Actinoplanes subtropicus TaxID=543632 RepID=UPI00068C4758|nr:APC family permease [Actinoplanes subtropicus]